MKQWRRLPFTLLALWAVLLTLMPQTLWACPVTGRVDVASRVCLGAMPAAETSSASELCAQEGGTCCKPLSLPPSSTTGADTAPQSQFIISTSDLGGQTGAPLASSLFPSVAILPAVEPIQAPAVRFYLSRFGNSPPSFWTQHRPLTCACRAPPVL